MRRPVRSLVTALAAASLLLTACGTGGSAAPPASGPGGAAASGPSGSITVLAAAGLTESFTSIAKDFEATHPGAKVTVSFGSSATLATQIVQGAPADVFASAAPKNMQQVVDAKAANPPRTIATNTLEIAVPASNPAKITSLNDLARPGVKVAIGAESLPAGIGARKVFAKANLTVTPATVEADVKAVLSKVTLGEVDAGIVWVTDVKAAGAKVEGIEIPADLNYSSPFSVATLTASKNPALATAFADYVLSPQGQAALVAAGYTKP